MTYDEITILIPSHSLEDFPTELDEDPAAGLLNAFAVAWHPALMAAAGAIPGWDRADEPPEELADRLVFVPTACEDWLPHGWGEEANLQGATVVEDLTDREEMLQAIWDGWDAPPEVDADLAADFFALGTCYLQLELLTCHMYHFSDRDEGHFQREALAAAEAAMADDAPAARSHLAKCFETLLEGRERFYPVDCYLLDLCLLVPQWADENLEATLRQGTPVNVMASGLDLETIGEQQPHLIQQLGQAWHGGTADILGGERDETAAPLLPLESALFNFRQGHAIFQKLFQRTPTTWGRRRFGFSTQLPQILSKFGYHAALHIAIDDGIFPETEDGKIRWEGCDGTVIDALSRIPLPAEGTASFLRFPMRMAESMEQDQVAAVIFARWPDVRSPFFEDFRRIARYSPVLGRFLTLEEFVQETDDPGRLSSFEAREYLSPFLLQAVAAGEKNPVSRFADHFLRRQRFEAGCWFRGMARLLSQGTVQSADVEHEEETVEAAGPDGTAEAAEKADAFLDDFLTRSAGRLAEIVMQGAGGTPGVLLLNPLSASRRVSLDLPQLQGPPEIAGPVQAVQFDGSRQTVTVDIPGCGFAWIPSEAAAEAPKTNQKANERLPMAEEKLLRNEFFEVYVNETTGGIGQIKNYGRSPNRLSQQVSFRFPHERALVVGDGEEAEEIKTPYAEMRCRSSRITCAGPSVGEIRTTGEIVDQETETRLAGFQQTMRVYRARPVVEVDLELEPERLPEGDPWSSYYAVRFAWNDSTASVTRSVLQGAHSAGSGRFESPHYLEIASEQLRTTILNRGLSFHRMTGPRMVDTLLVTAGETRRRFRFEIVLDEKYPLHAALNSMSPVGVVPTENGPPRVGQTGWFFHLNAKNVQVTRMLPPLAEPSEEDAEEEGAEGESNWTSGRGLALRLLETEGRSRSVRLRCFRVPSRARQRDFQGRTLTELTVDGDDVRLRLGAYEIADVELRFEG